MAMFNGQCSHCNRRDFLSRLGVLAGLTAVSPDLLAVLPPPVDPKLIAKKDGAVKVRIVYSLHKGGEVQNRPDWPNLGYDFRPVMKNMTDTLNWQIPEVEFIPTECYDYKQSVELVRKDEKENVIQGYLVVQLNCWNQCISGVWENTKKAIFYTPLPYAGDGGWLRHNSYIMTHLRPNYCSFAARDFSQVVKVAGAFAELKNGTAEDYAKKAFEIRKSLIPADVLPKDFKALEDKVACATPEEVKAKLAGYRILSVQRKLNAAFATECRERFGIEIEVVGFAEVNDAMHEADDAEARKVAEGWMKSASRVEYVKEDTIIGCAKLYLGMKAVLKKHNAKAITIDCLGGCYSGQLDAYPCLGFMQLQDDGLLGVCEDDLQATVTMAVFSALTKGRTGYVSDPVLDQPKRIISYAHCVSTRRFYGPEGKEAPFEILTHSEDRNGASVRAFAPVGSPVTTVILSPGRKKVAVHTGYVTENDLDDRACRTKIVAHVTGDYSKIELTWLELGWHRVTFLGDFAADVEAYAKAIGYELVRES